jgi:hypothetical protein
MNAGLKRNLGTLVQVLLASVLLVYVADWSVLHIRMHRGTAFGSVQVEQYLTTPLKGNKAEYDYMGTTAQSCSRSLFPQAGNNPCWWLERHKTQWQQ